MERMTGAAARRMEQAAWALRRATRQLSRRYGAWGWSMLACGAGAVLAGAALHYQLAEAAALQARLAARAAVAAAPPAPVAPAGGSSARARLLAFEQHLLAHEEIPFVVEELMALGGREGLVMQRGEYRPQADGPGAFLRYRMILPVTGAAPAVQRFMLAALRQHRNLALESVQFKRARVGAGDVEARIQWVMLSRLPARTAATEEGARP